MAADRVNKRKRKCNFTANEIDTLTEEINKRQDVLFGKPSPYNTPMKKIRAWEEVSLAVNAVASQTRTVLEIKNKWKQEKIRVKSKHVNILKERRKTGGGPAIPPTTDQEDKILSIIGSVSVAGLNDAVEIGLPSGLNQNPVSTTSINSLSMAFDEIPVEIIDILPPPPNFANNTVETQTDFQQQEQAPREPQNIFQQNEILLRQGEELNGHIATIASHLGDIKNYLQQLVCTINSKK